MNPLYNYTDADQINPVYCVGCRAHIPDALSKMGRGLCPQCLAKLAATPQAPPKPAAPPVQVLPPVAAQPPMMPPQGYAQPQYQAPKPPPLILTNPKKWWLDKGPIEKIVLILAPFCVLALILVSEVNHKDSPQSSAEVTPAKTPNEIRVEKLHAAQEAEAARVVDTKRMELAAEERVRGKRPIPSSWDTICPEANAWMRSNLKDYDSLKIVNGSDVVPFGNDAWCQRIKYRARNSFGGTVLEQKLFVMRNGQVLDVQDY